MPKVEYHNVREICVDGQTIAARSLIASVQPGKGIDMPRALAAINSGLAVPKDQLPPEKDEKPADGGPA